MRLVPGSPWFLSPGCALGQGAAVLGWTGCLDWVRLSPEQPLEARFGKLRALARPTWGMGHLGVNPSVRASYHLT